MSSVFSSLFGSAPSVSNQPTTSPQQQATLNQLLSGIQAGTLAPGSQTAFYTGPTAAGPSNLQTTSLTGLENAASGLNSAPTGQQNTATSTALDAFTQALTAPTPTIDPSTASAAFQQGVAQPLLTDFNTQILPGIAGKYGAGAGGAYSSDAMNARQQAGLNLDQTLAQQGSQYTLGAEEANQTAALTNQGNLAKLLSVAPSTTSLPSTTQGSTLENLISTLNAGAVPYNIAQTQDTANWQNYLAPLTQSNTSYQLGTQASLSPTQQAVTQGGSTGLIPSLLSGFASSGGLQSLFSGGAAAGSAGADGVTSSLLDSYLGAGTSASSGFAGLSELLPFIFA